MSEMDRERSRLGRASATTRRDCSTRTTGSSSASSPRRSGTPDAPARATDIGNTSARTISTSDRAPATCIVHSGLAPAAPVTLLDPNPHVLAHASRQLTQSRDHPGPGRRPQATAGRGTVRLRRPAPGHPLPAGADDAARPVRWSTSPPSSRPTACCSARPSWAGAEPLVAGAPGADRVQPPGRLRQPRRQRGRAARDPRGVLRARRARDRRLGRDLRRDEPAPPRDGSAEAWPGRAPSSATTAPLTTPMRPPTTSTSTRAPLHRQFVARLLDTCPPAGDRPRCAVRHRPLLRPSHGLGAPGRRHRPVGRDAGAGAGQGSRRARARRPPGARVRPDAFDAVMCVDAMEYVPPEDWPLGPRQPASRRAAGRPCVPHGRGAGDEAAARRGIRGTGRARACPLFAASSSRARRSPATTTTRTGSRSSRWIAPRASGSSTRRTRRPDGSWGYRHFLLRYAALAS